jgi:hypothetical protein
VTGPSKLVARPKRSQVLLLFLIFPLLIHAYTPVDVPWVFE